MIPITPGMVKGGIQALGGLAEGLGGLIGQKKRKKDQRDARAEYDQRIQDYENLDTSNLGAQAYGNLKNPYEDATVNTQAADFLAQQQQQGLANTMQAMSGAAGGSGIAALAQSMANVQGQQAQQASASIAQQEQRNQMAFMGQQAANQSALAQATYSGAKESRALVKEKTEEMAIMSADKKAQAEQAVQDARTAMVGGFMDVAGGVGRAMFSGEEPEEDVRR